MVNNLLDIESILESALTDKKLISMQVRKLKKTTGELYCFRLQGIGDRKGFSEIRIMQEGDDIVLEDQVSLPKNNKGFEEDITLLKKFMYEDLGVVASGDVRELAYRGKPEGCALSFKVSREKAQEVLYHYIDIASEVMGGFFRKYAEIHLAFSLARERVGK